jgi:hypothetical protein
MSQSSPLPTASLTPCELIAFAEHALQAALQAEGTFELASLNFEPLAARRSLQVEAHVVLDRVTRSLAFATANLVDLQSARPIALVRTVWRRKADQG